MGMNWTAILRIRQRDLVEIVTSAAVLDNDPFQPSSSFATWYSHATGSALPLLRGILISSAWPIVANASVIAAVLAGAPVASTGIGNASMEMCVIAHDSHRIAKDSGLT